MCLGIASAAVFGRWLSIAAPARAQVMQQLPQADIRQQRRACELASILLSLKNLENYSCVRQRLDQMAISLHGWYFDMDAGTLLAYSARTDAFLPLVCPFIPELKGHMLA